MHSYMFSHLGYPLNPGFGKSSETPDALPALHLFPSLQWILSTLVTLKLALPTTSGNNMLLLLVLPNCIMLLLVMLLFGTTVSAGCCADLSAATLHY